MFQNSTIFKAIQISEENQKFKSSVIERTFESLPEGEILIKVLFSSLNYKDALSHSGNKGITKKIPHTPGIDAAGIIESSDDERFMKGEEVIVTGYDLGMNTSGGLSEYIRVPADWVVKKPKNLSLRESMILGTAGFTAGLCLEVMFRNGVQKANAPIIVTGATGGVGSLSIMMLKELGFDIHAVTGKSTAHEFLQKLGVSTVLSREESIDLSNKPLLKGIYGGGIDTVGGEILSSILKSMKPHAVIACCGMVASSELKTTVFPFILRGIILAGVDSAETQYQKRVELWEKLATTYKPKSLESIARQISLDEVPHSLQEMLNGNAFGKTLVKIQ